MADKVLCIATFALSLSYLYATSLMRSPQIGDPLGPKAFPFLVAIGLLVAAALLFLEIRKAETTECAVGAERHGNGHLLVIGAVIAWTLLYFAAFERLGYLIATTIYLLVLTSGFNRGRWVANILTSLLFSVGAYLVFARVVEVPLPRGLLGF